MCDLIIRQTSIHRFYECPSAVKAWAARYGSIIRGRPHNYGWGNCLWQTRMGEDSPTNS